MNSIQDPGNEPIEAATSSTELIGVVFDKQARAVFKSDAKATLAALAAASLSDCGICEIPRDQYDAVLQALEPDNHASSSITAATAPAQRLRPASITYRQAYRAAQGQRIEGMRLDPADGSVQSDCGYTDCGYTLSFLVDHARAIWSGLGERDAIAAALGASLHVGSGFANDAGLTSLTSAEEAAALKAAETGGAITGIARSPIGKGVIDTAMGTLSNLSGTGQTTRLALLGGAGPLASVLSIGVANLDFYRVALARNISWRQFSKNMVVKTSGIIAGTGGWVGGAAAGSVIGGPVGALIGGILGAVSGGSVGSASAKRVADRLIKDDATALMAIVQQSAEQLAFEFLLTQAEVAELAKGLQTLVTPTWLRAMFHASHGKSGASADAIAEASRRYADAELETLCQEVIVGRSLVPVPERKLVSSVVEEIKHTGDLGPT